MFTSYTEEARRAKFFGRFEAGNWGSTCIEPEHLLLGVLREDRTLAQRFGLSVKASPDVDGGIVDVTPVRKEIEAITPCHAKSNVFVEMSLSQSSNRALTYAVAYADAFGHKHVGTEHLFLGILRENNDVTAKIMGLHDIDWEATRKWVETLSVEEHQPHATHPDPAAPQAGITNSAQPG
jgi:ATP-dependent Clp protease ATP-binding subunit ClpC